MILRARGSMLLAIISLSAACSNAGEAELPRLALEEVPANGATAAPVSCRTDFDETAALADGGDPLVLILDAVDQARADDERCGQRPARDRLCRSLWLTATLDPVALLQANADPEAMRRASAALAWAAGELNDVDPDIAGALAEVAALDGIAIEMMITDAFDNDLADVLMSRSTPELLDSLGAAEAIC